jgi:hypothetical protein
MAVGLTWADLIGGHARVDVVRADGRTYNSIAAGGHFGQRAGIGVGLLLGAAFAILNAVLE